MVKQINLIPVSKQESAKQSRVRRLITSIATAVIVVSIGVPLLLLGISGSQKFLLNRTQGQIDERKNQLRQVENIATMLTVKDHLASLPALYDKRLFASELLLYISSVLPQEIRLSSVEIDAATSTIQFSGTAPTYTSAEKFYKALLVAGTDLKPDSVEPNPNLTGLFTNLTLQDVSGPSGTEVNFTINASFSFELTDGVTENEAQE